MSAGQAGLGSKIPNLGLCGCRKTIGEFRRTHEEAALAEARKALTADQWDALQSVASPATYFA